MARFQVGDEVYIKGVVGEIIKEGTNYPVRVSTYEGWGVDSFTLDGRFREADEAPSLFRASEIQSRRECKIGQKLNGLAEVMQAILDGQFVKGESAGMPRALKDGRVNIFDGQVGDISRQSLDAIELQTGTIAEDPAPKKMVAWDNNGHILILPPDVDVHSVFKKITKQELAAILERVE